MTLFNTIPGNLVAPIITFEVNSGGQFENQSRGLLIGHKINAGAASANVPVACLSPMEGRRLAGAGSMLDDSPDGEDEQMRIVPILGPDEPLRDPDLVWDGRAGDLEVTGLADPTNPG